VIWARLCSAGLPVGACASRLLQIDVTATPLRTRYANL
jgi:hypothetical protein